MRLPEGLQRSTFPIIIAIVVFISAYRIQGGDMDFYLIGATVPGVLALGLLFYWIYRNPSLLWWLSRRSHHTDFLPYQQAIFELTEKNHPGRFDSIGDRLGFFPSKPRLYTRAKAALSKKSSKMPVGKSAGGRPLPLAAPSVTARTQLSEALLFSLQSFVLANASRADPWLESIRRTNSEVHSRWQTALLLYAEAAIFAIYPVNGYTLIGLGVVILLILGGFLVFKSGSHLDQIANTKNLCFVRLHESEFTQMLQHLS